MEEVVAARSNPLQETGVRVSRRDYGSTHQIPAEDRLAAAPLVIDPAEWLLLVEIVVGAVRNLAARIGRRGQLLGEVHRRHAEPRRVDPVADKRCSQRHLPPAVARRRRKGREVTRQHRGCRHERDVRGRQLTLDRPLVGAEKEQTVSDDRTAQRPAKLTALEAVILALAVGTDAGKGTLRVEMAIPEELEPVPGAAVRARLGDRIDTCPRVHAVLGGQPAGRDPEFLQRVRERQRQVGVGLRVVVRRAVEHVGDAKRQAAGDRDRHAAWNAALRDAGLDGSASQNKEVRDLASLQRQLHDPLVLDDRADARAAHVHERGRGVDRHCFLDAAHRQHGIDDRRCGDLQHDAGLLVASEPRQRDFQPVRTGRQIRQNVGPGVVGHGRTGETRIGLRHRDSDAGQHGAAFVAHRATELGRCLRRDRAGGQQKDQSPERETPV